VNKAVKGTISIEEAKSLIFCTWDIVDFSSTVPYSERITRLTDVAFGTQIRVLATLIVKTKEDAQKFFEKCLDAGEEGAMIKNMNHVWQPKRTKECGKLKAEKTADLIIVDVFEGEGKYAGMLGGFICETSDGLLQVRVGSGFSDAQRKEFWNMNMKGTIVEVMYNAKITSKSKEKASLFLPRFLSIRFDKDIANTLEELK
jgi:ATP-dependent DNA ligase